MRTIKWKSELFFLVLALFATGVFYIITLRAGHNWGGDFSLYILNARNLVEGRGYSSWPWIYNIQYPGLSPKLYPPAFPLLLAPVIAIWGVNLTAMKILVISQLLTALLALYILARLYLRPFTSLLLVLITGFNPYLWHFSNQIKPEFTFITLLFLTLYIHGRSKKSRTWGIATGALLYLTYATRSIGLILAVALIIEGIIRRPRRWFYLFTAMVVLTLGIVLENAYIPDLSSYHGMFYFSIPRVIANIQGYVSVLAYTMDNGYLGSLMTIAAIIVYALSLVGFIKRISKGPDALDIFVIIYVCAVAIWPYFQARYMVPLIPFVLFYALYLIDDLPFLKKNHLAYVLAGLVLTIYAVKYTAVDYSPLKEGITKAESTELFNFVRKNIPHDAVVTFAKPRVLSLMTRRKSLAVQFPVPDSTIMGILKKQGVSFVILSKWSPDDIKYLVPFIFHHKDRFRLVYSNGDFKVLRLIRQ